MSDVDFIGAHLVPSPGQLLRLQRVAAGAEPADLAVRDGTVLALHGRELLRRDVLICGPHIAAVTPPGRLAATSEIDAAGCWVSPGFIDTHLHIEYTLLTPGELARLTVPRGTTTVLADPNCLANVLGPVGMDIAGTTGTPLRIFRQVSHKVPRTPELELGGGAVPEGEILARLSDPLAVTLGESNPFDLEDSAARKSHRALAAGRRITGHTARIASEPLWSYAAAGVFDDHNAFEPDEVIERLRLGIGITVMSGSMNDNVRPLFADPARVAGGFDQFTFCADDRHVGDLAGEGHIDHHVRTAIDCGVEPVEAYRMATLNAARSYRLDHLLGSITPTRLADLMLLEDLEDVRPSLVLVGGEIAGRDGAAAFANDDTLPESCRGTVRLHPDIGPESFRVEVPTRRDREGRRRRPQARAGMPVDAIGGHFPRPPERHRQRRPVDAIGGHFQRPRSAANRIDRAMAPSPQSPVAGGAGDGDVRRLLQAGLRGGVGHRGRGSVSRPRRRHRQDRRRGPPPCQPHAGHGLRSRIRVARRRHRHHHELREPEPRGARHLRW